MTARILVTGGSGFIGTNLVERYLSAGEAVLNADLNPPRNRSHASIWRPLDVCDPSAVSSLFEDFGPTHVFHLAARTDLEGPTVADYTANTTGVEVLVSAIASAATVERSIFASSRMVCAIDLPPEHPFDYSPPNAYGRSKVIGEQLVRGSGLAKPWVIVRPTSIWGPWFGTPYREFFLSVARRRYRHPRGLDPRKSFGYVGNAVHALDRLMFGQQTAVDGSTLYLADYEPVSVLGLAHMVGDELNVPVRSAGVPVLRIVAKSGDALKRTGLVSDPPLTTFRLNNLLTDMVFDMSPLADAVGPLPFSHADGVKATVAYLRETNQV